MFLLGQIYKYGSGNSKVTSLPVSFRYTEAKVSTCKNKKKNIVQKNIMSKYMKDEYFIYTFFGLNWCKNILHQDRYVCFFHTGLNNQIFSKSSREILNVMSID